MIESNTLDRIVNLQDNIKIQALNANWSRLDELLLRREGMLKNIFSDYADKHEYLFRVRGI